MFDTLANWNEIEDQHSSGRDENHSFDFVGHSEVFSQQTVLPRGSSIHYISWMPDFLRLMQPKLAFRNRVECYV